MDHWMPIMPLIMPLTQNTFTTGLNSGTQSSSPLHSILLSYIFHSNFLDCHWSKLDFYSYSMLCCGGKIERVYGKLLKVLLNHYDSKLR